MSEDGGRRMENRKTSLYMPLGLFPLWTSRTIDQMTLRSLT